MMLTCVRLIHRISACHHHSANSPQNPFPYDYNSELVVNFTSTEPRFETPGDDPRLFKGTAEALKELAAGPPLEFPNEDWSREQLKDWFRTIDPAIGAVWAAWAGEIPAEIAECVEKTDLEHKGIPVRILKKKSTSDDLPVVVYYHGGGLSGKQFGLVTGSLKTDFS
jgi:hypothetical protein